MNKQLTYNKDSGMIAEASRLNKQHSKIRENKQ